MGVYVGVCMFEGVVRWGWGWWGWYLVPHDDPVPVLALVPPANHRYV